MKRNHKTTTFDPPVSTTDDGRYITLSISLPDVTEEQIRIDLERTTLTLTVLGDGNTLSKTIRVLRGVRIFRKKFSGEVLEIVLEKPADP